MSDVVATTFDPGAEWESAQPPICGAWISPDSSACLAMANSDGTRTVTHIPFNPFAWTIETAQSDAGSSRSERLTGDGQLTHLAHFADVAAYKDWLEKRPRNTDSEMLRSLESQFLLQRTARMFTGLTFPHLRRIQIDIETGCSEPGGFSDASRVGDRVLAIGIGTVKAQDYWNSKR